MKAHRDQQVAAFLTETLDASAASDRARIARRLFRDWASVNDFYETSLGDGYTLEASGDRDLGYGLDILARLRVPRRRVMHVAYILGHLHGLRPSLREMNDPAAFEHSLETRYRLTSNISSKDLAMIHRNIAYDDMQSIHEIVGLLKAGVPAEYLGAMTSVEAYRRYGWNEYDIYEAWKLGVDPLFLSATWEHSGSLALMLWRKGVPLEYLKTCNAAGLGVYETMAAWAENLPVEYAVAVGAEER